MIHVLLNLLFGRIKKPFYTNELSREEREFINRHWPQK